MPLLKNLHFCVMNRFLYTLYILNYFMIQAQLNVQIAIKLLNLYNTFKGVKSIACLYLY